jgi:hypothetical protein
MVAIPLAILALAAGVYLVTYVKQFSLGGLYKYLSWLVILLSLACILGGVARGVMHYRHMRECMASGQCDMKGGAACPYMKPGNGCMQNGNCNMMGHDEGGMKDCCKDMKGMGSCPDMKDGNAKSSCCKKDAAADSTAKK